MSAVPVLIQTANNNYGQKALNFKLIIHNKRNIETVYIHSVSLFVAKVAFYLYFLFVRFIKRSCPHNKPNFFLCAGNNQSAFVAIVLVRFFLLLSLQFLLGKILFYRMVEKEIRNFTF